MPGRHASTPKKETRRGKKRKGIEAQRGNIQPHPRQLMHPQGTKSRTENRREEKERYRGTEGETPNFITGN